MKLMHLDFLNTKIRQKHKSNFIVVSVLALVALGMLFEHQNITNKIAEIENMAAKSTELPILQAKPTAEDIRGLKSAVAIQQKLNLPWQELLASLERVKKESSLVTLMAIQPDPISENVMITAEVIDQEAMLAFVSSLENQAEFFNVLLINQRNLNIDDSSQIAFTLKMRWKI